MKPSLKLILVVIGAVLFNIIFWQEKLAVNALIFDVFVLSSVFYLYPAALRSPVMKWLLTAHLVTLSAVIFHNTLLSKLGFCTTLLLFVIFTQYQHRSVWYAAASVFMNYLMAPASMLSSIRLLHKKEFKTTGLRRAVRLLVIPTLLLLLFFGLYNFANPVFQSIINDIGLAVSKYFSRFFEWFSWERSGFLLLGLFITAGLLLKSSVTYFSDTDKKRSDLLWRKRKNLAQGKASSWFELLSLIMGRFASGIMALRNENTTGLISLVLLNVLLLFINCIDIVYVWFGFSYQNDINLSEYVHEGTGLLIFSILLAMVLLLFFFRGNLNFYKRNKWLQYGAYAWLFQNAILVVSVLFRDYYYIAHYGLAYKRIGVLLFLSSVLVGLITVFIKIQQRKTAYYLLRVNAWSAIIMLVTCSCIHWDELIAKYNLAKKDTIVLDVKFLLTLSDKTLPLLNKNTDVLDKPATVKDGEGAYLNRSKYTLRQQFELRKQEFLKEQKTYSWLSWNFADQFVSNQIGDTMPVSSLSHQILKYGKTLFKYQGGNYQMYPAYVSNIVFHDLSLP